MTPLRAPRRAALLVSLLPGLTLLPVLAQEGDAPRPGALVVVGGGGTPAEVLSAALTRCRATRRVLVLPQASELEGRGLDSAEMWREAGAAEAVVLDPLAPDAGRAALARADLIWLPGGDQVRLVEALRAADLLEPLREAHRRGAVVGGTSAGAAAQGDWMLTGQAELERVVPGGTELVPGLGLWPEALVDQHFLARRRQARLLSAVLDRPGLVGVGIDERTAVLVEGGELLVLGEGAVLVYDARQARLDPRRGAEDVRLHLLRPGTRWRLAP